MAVCAMLSRYKRGSYPGSRNTTQRRHGAPRSSPTSCAGGAQPPARGRRAAQRRPPPHARPAPRGGRRCSPGWAPPGTRGSSRAATCAPRMEVLEAIAEALRLNARRARAPDAARARRGGAARARRGRDVSPTLRRLVENLGPSPAYMLGRRWDYLAWNRALAPCSGDPAEVPARAAQPPLADVHGPGAPPALSTDWEAGARSALAKFRADNARHLGDPDFEELIDGAARQASEEFRCWWKRHEVARSGIGAKALNHPELGKLGFEHAVVQARGEPRAAPDPLLAAAQVQHPGEAGAAAGGLSFFSLRATCVHRATNSRRRATFLWA